MTYVEWSDTPTGTARVVLQRFGPAAERVGPLLELANDPDQYAGVTLASDGTQYAACWDSSAEVHCALVDSEGTIQQNILELPGQHPTLVAAPNGWVIAFAATDTTLRLQSLSQSLRPTSTSVDFERSLRFASAKAGALLTATPSGFALVGARADDGREGLLRLDANLRPLGPAIPLGRDFWFYGQLVASDERAAVSLSAPYGSYLLLLDAEQVTAELPIAGGGKTGTDQAFLLSDGAIEAAWLTRDAGIGRRDFSDGHDAEVGLESRGTDDLLGLEEQGTDSYQQLLRVEDQTLLVARAHRFGYLEPAPIRAVVLTSP